MRRRRRSSSFKLLGMLVLIAIAGYRGWRGEWPLEDLRSPPSSRSAVKVFEVWPEASLVEDRDNDGDSFKVRYQGKEHVLRLYFADCPEKRRHSYNAQRIAEQGSYFGGLSERETVALGLRAKARAEEWLRSRRFTVCTKWQSVYGSGRYYAFVIFDDGEDLSEKLVREGLARIHTTGATLPDGRSRAAFEAHLRRLEHEARAARRGGWGM